VANLGMTDIRLTHPVYIGDTLYAESVCTGLRPSGSRPGFGVVSMRTRGLNQDGEEILSWARSVMLPSRASGVGTGYFPEARTGPMSTEALHPDDSAQAATGAIPGGSS